MNVPPKMKSGSNLTSIRKLPDIFCITILCLDGILKRCGMKDAYLYKTHNKNEELDFTLISSGIHFNLFSEHGVGKLLLPLIEELLKNVKLDPIKYRNNIFYKEIVRLVPEILPIIREINSKKETKWTYSYALKSVNITEGELENERLSRLSGLIRNVKGERCSCKFCVEFRKHHAKKSKHIDWYIIDTILAIDKEING